LAREPLAQVGSSVDVVVDDDVVTVVDEVVDDTVVTVVDEVDGTVLGTVDDVVVLVLVVVELLDVVVGVTHGHSPMQSPWARWAGTADAPTA